jgi:hypothetical protein
VKVTRATLIGAALLYVVLWILALNGANSLIAPLLIPLILAAIVVMGVALSRFMGLSPRKQHFRDREDEPGP